MSETQLTTNNIQSLANSSSYSGDGIVTTSYDDDYIVRGNAFTSQLVLSLTSGMNYVLFSGNGSASDTIFTIPPRFSADDGQVIVSFRLGSDYSGGAELAYFNRNATSPNTPKAKLALGATGTDEGTIQSQYLIGTTGGFFTSGGGQTSGDKAFIIPANAIFLVEINNQSGGTINFGYTFTWYEL